MATMCILQPSFYNLRLLCCMVHFDDSFVAKYSSTFLHVSRVYPVRPFASASTVECHARGGGEIANDDKRAAKRHKLISR